MDKLQKHRLIILSGPSCVGKTPLKEAFERLYPKIYNRMYPLVLYNSREIRPGESDGIHYFYRSVKEIRKLEKDSKYIVFKVHGDHQAIDKKVIQDLLMKKDVFLEGNTTVGRLFQSNPDFAGINMLTIFLSPLSGQEVLKLRSHGKKFFRETIQKMMRQKLLYRLQNLGTSPDQNQIKDLERRANDTYLELKEAFYFDYIIPNHDGEDSDNWDRFLFPSGDAGRALSAFAAILANKDHPIIEKWEENLVP